jgi:formylglycine-generating enzyme required for sulfatase activity
MVSSRLVAVCAALAIVVPAAPAQTPLAWRLNPNDRLYVEYHVKNQDNSTLQGKPLDSTEESTQVYRFTVLSRTPDGGLVLEVRLESLRCSKADSPRLEQTRRLHSEVVRATLDANMNVVRIDGCADILRGSAGARPSAQLAFEQRLLEDEVRTMIAETFIALPNHPTSKGEQWQQTLSTAAVGIGVIVLKRTFADDGDDTLDGRPVRRIVLHGDMTVQPPDWNEAEQPVQRWRCQIKKQNHDGTLYFDMAAGRVVACERRNSLLADYLSTVSASQTPEGSGEQTMTATVRVHDHNPLLEARPKIGPTATQPPPSGANSIGLRLVGIPAGKFWMGSPDDEDRRNCNETLHEVANTKAFYLGTHEVTVGQFRQFVEATGYRTAAETDGLGADGWNAEKRQLEHGVQYNWKNPGYPQTDNHPVVLVDWKDVKTFCAWLSEREGRVYRLPTEAEWEYACRAGTNTRFYSGDDAESVAAYGNLHAGQLLPAPVGSSRPNAWGLYDMHGNAAEWCEDWFWDYDLSARTDPTGPAISSMKVTRGGSWLDEPVQGRSATRAPCKANSRSINVGFRVVLENPN